MRSMQGSGAGKSMSKMAGNISKATAMGKGLRKGLTKMRQAKAGKVNAVRKAKVGKGRQR
jgi:hypothetical protein